MKGVENMKTYINEQNKECIVTLTELKSIDEWTKVIDLKPIKKILEALEILGKDIEGIYIQYVYFDVDTKYYRRFPDEVIEELWKRIDRNGHEQKVIFKNNRLYIEEDGLEIICPEGMYSRYSDYDKRELNVTIRWN